MANDTINIAPGVSERAAAAIVAPRTTAQIDAEKAAKPRVDLIPATALAAIGAALSRESVAGGTWGLGDVLERLAHGARVRSIETLADAWLLAAVALKQEGDLDVAAGHALLDVGAVMAVGFVKHGPCTWRVAGTSQAEPQTHYACACRHVAEALAGRDADPDSGRPPLVHALAQIAILIDLLVDPPQLAGQNDGHAMIAARPPDAPPPGCDTWDEYHARCNRERARYEGTRP